MSLTITYNRVLKRSETVKIQLPDLKSSCLVLSSFEINTSHKEVDFKLKGKDIICSYGEAVFYQTCLFDLSDKLSQIIEADKITVDVKNLCTVKDMSNINIKLTFTYAKMDEGIILFNNIYTMLNADGLSNILGDISKAGKHITKIILTSPNQISSVELVPQFESDPIWLKPVKFVSNKNNQIIIDLNSDELETDLIPQLCHYTLTVPDNLEKLGVIVYGYTH